ncbi:MAG: hypothetical protein CMP33_03660 [Rickettsiales bacterium]|nr:hypothetical protein [Rickettsiales bacterium]|tara:strand:+ start:100 stop:705 length:606 start_codon:yes stop_codon:yes gene_type:complete
MEFRSILILLLLLPFGVFSQDPLVKSKLFIEDLGKRVIKEVANPKIDNKQRENNFRKLYLDAFDDQYISKFVLGRHWKKIDNKTKEDFVKSFNDYLVMVYAPKFKGWTGTFKAISSAELKENLFLVEMNLISKSGGAPQIKLDWRMYINSKKKFKILDVNIDGVSMLITQRAEFSSVIKNDPKGVIGLLEKMKKKTNSSKS